MKTCPPEKSAFTLIEVTLALGVASFCLLTVFGLLPVGITANQNASEQTAAAGVATAISADLHSNPVASSAAVSSSTSRFHFIIPQPGNATPSVQTLFFSADGAPSASIVASGASPSRYRATVTMQPADANLANPPTPYNKLFKANVLITWPALADPNPNVAPVNFAGSFVTATSVDCN